ncbi:hypothetical protein G6O67_004341 [Ophiocordyceps sinensis]|uniref:IDI-2 n=1 Tax=Ophiocordyceps sinensis TaxID=72228 RepID=A0A8H4LZR7_9HYPO|nr:hypothetical protein G6O67_004341 [Ophiocordyceps sinensis]
MKNTIFAAVAIQAAGVLSLNSTAVAECGALGVMETSQLPAHVDANAVRKCVDHPLALTKLDQPLAKRECRFDSKFGCTNGYCWRRCGRSPDSGEWCWTAWNSGMGNWITCLNSWQCNFNLTSHGGCGFSFWGRDCKSCGCSC